jgi:hypothetical protein
MSWTKDIPSTSSSFPCIDRVVSVPAGLCSACANTSNNHPPPGSPPAFATGRSCHTYSSCIPCPPVARARLVTCRSLLQPAHQVMTILVVARGE